MVPLQTAQSTCAEEPGPHLAGSGHGDFDAGRGGAALSTLTPADVRQSLRTATSSQAGCLPTRRVRIGAVLVAANNPSAHRRAGPLHPAWVCLTGERLNTAKPRAARARTIVSPQASLATPGTLEPYDPRACVRSVAEDCTGKRHSLLPARTSMDLPVGCIARAAGRALLREIKDAMTQLNWSAHLDAPATAHTATPPPLQPACQPPWLCVHAAQLPGPTQDCLCSSAAACRVFQGSSPKTLAHARRKCSLKLKRRGRGPRAGSRQRSAPIGLRCALPWQGDVPPVLPWMDAGEIGPQGNTPDVTRFASPGRPQPAFRTKSAARVRIVCFLSGFRAGAMPGSCWRRRLPPRGMQMLRRALRARLVASRDLVCKLSSSFGCSYFGR